MFVNIYSVCMCIDTCAHAHVYDRCMSEAKDGTPHVYVCMYVGNEYVIGHSRWHAYVYVCVYVCM
jgi:hypothetical protein